MAFSRVRHLTVVPGEAGRRPHSRDGGPSRFFGRRNERGPRRDRRVGARTLVAVDAFQPHRDFVLIEGGRTA